MTNAKQVVVPRKPTKDEPAFVATTAFNDIHRYMMGILGSDNCSKRFRCWLYRWDETVRPWDVCVAVIRVLTFRVALVDPELPTSD